MELQVMFVVSPMTTALECFLRALPVYSHHHIHKHAQGACCRIAERWEFSTMGVGGARRPGVGVLQVKFFQQFMDRHPY